MVQRKLPPKLDHVKTEDLQDVKNNNRIADLKLKMKKSGSIKKPELDNLSSKRHAKRPGEPPRTPNYMKSTTSSDARKEQSPVSTKSPQTSSSDSSKLTLASGNKATKTMRSLTKSPSFKPARALVKKCSPVVLCEDLDAQRATCSSTLKDCKFPAYLSLNPGGTESEGTSAMKVCPYTYCSLNGHHHAPLPPLKCFLSARRLVLKTQRSMKLGCLSPKRVKGIGDGDEKVLKSSTFSPLAEQEQTGIDGSPSDSVIVDLLPSFEGKDDETVAEDEQERALEAPPDAPLCDQFDMPPPVSVQEEEKQGFLGELLIDSVLDSESSDVDWERGYHSSQNLDYDCDYEYSLEMDIEPDPDASEVETHPIHGVLFITKSDKKEGLFDEFLVDQVSQESMDDESLTSDAFSTSDDGKSTDSYDYLQSFNITKASLDEGHQVQIELSYEDQTKNTENPGNSSPMDPAEASDPEVALLKCSEAESNKAHQVKAETEDRALALAVAKCKKHMDDTDESGLFNPKEPNFLPVEPDPDAEKVDLRHQDLDERKNSEEWMVDYALRQVVTKLGPARKTKVSLLVEAFEKVMPITKCELHLRHSSAFDQARPIQACN